MNWVTIETHLIGKVMCPFPVSEQCPIGCNGFTGQNYPLFTFHHEDMLGLSKETLLCCIYYHSRVFHYHFSQIVTIPNSKLWHHSLPLFLGKKKNILSCIMESVGSIVFWSLLIQRWKSGNTKTTHSQKSYFDLDVFSADLLTCHGRCNTGVTNNIKAWRQIANSFKWESRSTVKHIFLHWWICCVTWPLLSQLQPAALYLLDYSPAASHCSRLFKADIACQFVKLPCCSYLACQYSHCTVSYQSFPVATTITSLPALTAHWFDVYLPLCPIND